MPVAASFPPARLQAPGWLAASRSQGEHEAARRPSPQWPGGGGPGSPSSNTVGPQASRLASASSQRAAAASWRRARGPSQGGGRLAGTAAAAAL
jgi:hypothetical protein